jgi:hypothetical protein
MQAQLAIQAKDACLPLTITLLPLETYCAIFSRYSVDAIRKKIARRDWTEGKEYHRAPDRSIWIDIAGVERWATSSETSKSMPAKSASSSGLRADCTEKL